MDNGETKPAAGIRWGTGLLVTAAFIGPGTVLTASLAGAQAGYSLLWAVLFSVAAASLLQILAARLGWASGGGIGEAVRRMVTSPFPRWGLLGLILLAILYGNCAYQTGNLLGAAAGLSILSGLPSEWGVLLLGGVAVTVLWLGGLGWLQRILVALVAIMSLVFVWAAIGSRPDPAALAAGLIPRVSGWGAWSLVIGLIGTTVVPYNLFLHAGAVAEQRGGATEQGSVLPGNAEGLRRLGWDTILAVAIGGLITMAILIVAATSLGGSQKELKTVGQVAVQLESAVGGWGETIFAIGLLAAGVTSAVTAPMAAGYCAAGCFGWPCRLSDSRVRGVATLVVAVGVGLGWFLGASPVQTILLAQIANGLVLPVLAIFLVVATNQTSLMGRDRNGGWLNLGAGLVVLVTTAIAARTLVLAWQKVGDLWSGS